MVTTTTGIATEFINFTRASNATVTDSDGKVKWAPHNLLLASESFDAAAWSKTSVTPTANSIAAPNGTTTADTLAASGANGTTLQTFTAEAISYTFSVWLRRKTGTGTIEIAADSGTYTAVTITSSWALYTVTQTPAAGSKSAGIRIVTSGDEVYAWGAHLYRSDLAMQPNTSAYPMYNPTTPKNLLGYTEDFSNAYWTKNGLVTVGMADVTTAPNSLQTADQFVETAASGTHIAYVNISGSKAVTISVAAKANTRSVVTIAGQDGGGTNWAAAAFNLSAPGTAATAQAGGTFSGTSSITPLGNGWYRCTLSVTSSGVAVAQVKYGVANSATPTFGSFGDYSYTGDGTSGIYVWGAQFSDSASLDPYVPVYGAAVTSAAYYGPRRDFDGATLACKGLLVEEQRANLLLYSADFTQSAWSKVNATIAAATAPDGTSTAVTLTGTGAGATLLRQDTAVSSATVDVSYYVKAGTATTCAIGDVNIGVVGVFNLSSGIVISGSGATIFNAGGEWYRCSITYTAIGGFARQAINPGSTFSGTTTSSIVVWGAQCELGSFATSYIPVGATTAGATRLADVASVSTQAFPYSATEGTLVAAFNGMVVSGTATNAVVSISDGTTSNRIDSYSDAFYSLYVVSGGSPQANIDAGTVSVNTVTKIGSAFAENNFAAVINGGTVGTDPSGTVPTVNRMYIGAGSAGGQQLNGHIRQITYLPRRISNTELQTRTA